VAGHAGTCVAKASGTTCRAAVGVCDATESCDGTSTACPADAMLPEAARAGHGDVWDHYLPRLAVAAAGGDPGPDPWAAEISSWPAGGITEL